MKRASRKKAHVSLTKNSIVMLTMLVVIVLATMSWFTVSRYSEGLDVYVGTDKSNVIQFAYPLENGECPTDEDSFFSVLDFQGQLKDDTFIQEVTGDGVTLIRPTLKTDTDGSLVVDTGTDKGWSKAIPNQDYASVTFYVRSTVDNLYVDRESYLETESKLLTANLANGTTDDTDESEIDNQSSYGNFSKDGIAGAVRVSLVDVTDTSAPTVENRKLLWIPRPDLKLTKSGTEYLLMKGVTSGGSYSHSGYVPLNSTELSAENGTGVKQYIADTTVTPVVTDNPDAIPVLADNVLVASGAEATVMNGVQYYYYKFTLNIWIEGTDTESVTALNGGKFRLRLNFTAE